MKMDSHLVVEELLSLCLQRTSLDEDTERLAKLLRSMEACRKRWLQAELDLKRFKELLVKSDVSKAALEVKLKHARNQLDVEMKKRYKTEADYQYLQRQMQLMCDILVHDRKCCLNDEQKSLLATFEHKGANATLHRSSKRLSVIDESSFLSHSDISYDRTEDDVDLDTTMIKPLRSRPREKRRSSMGMVAGAVAVKRGRGGSVVCAELQERKSVEKEVQTVVKTFLVNPDAGGQRSGHTAAGIGQEMPECAEQTSAWSSCDEAEPKSAAKMEDGGGVQAASLAPKSLKHVFLSKTVIRPESCSSCGKRIRFGKMVVKCRNCGMVVHPECKEKCEESCSAPQPNSLESFAAAGEPRIPALVAECVKEIERRGLEERGLYRVPGTERVVKELRQKFLQRKAVTLSKVDDVHVVCGVLKDFLRKLQEPLITFRLHGTFMEASEMADEDESATMMLHAVGELPKANRDTLAFLMLHLHRVMRSPQCEMDQNNLARVFGPTIVGHATSEPSPATIMRDTNMQPKVVCRLLSLPEDFWRRLLSVHKDQSLSSTSKTSSQEESHGRLFKPLTSPELSSYSRAPSMGSLRGRIRKLGNAFSSTGPAEPGRRFFTSPS
ncbi:hypothetical protein LDENG_00171280 [Lucifuga dentata]|nr:hypothetical protein LDENG_00171280 [Lucifuga dentata]